MSQKNNTTLTGLINIFLDKSLQFIKWFIGTFIPKATTFLWDKSFSLSGFIIEAIEAKKGAFPPLERRALKNLFSLIIFLLMLILLLVLMKIFS